jgi:cullin 3
MEMDDILNMSLKRVKQLLNKKYDMIDFEEVYRDAYTLVLHHYGEKLYRSTQEVILEHLIQEVH